MISSFLLQCVDMLSMPQVFEQSLFLLKERQGGMPCVLRGGKRGDLMLPPRLPEEEALRGFFETGGTAAALQGGKRKRKRFFPLSSLFEGRTRPRICCLRLFLFFLLQGKKNILDLLLSRLLFRFRFRQRVIKYFSGLVQSEFLSTEGKRRFLLLVSLPRIGLLLRPRR